MKQLVALALAGAVAFTPAAYAADPPKAAVSTTTAPAAAPAKTAAPAAASAPTAAPAKAAEPKAPNAQQERMKSCNEKAKGKTGDDRKKFMSSCLSN